MHVENLLDDLPGSRASKPAFGRDTEIIDVFPRHIDAAARSLRAVLGMDET